MYKENGRKVVLATCVGELVPVYFVRYMYLAREHKMKI